LHRVDDAHLVDGDAVAAPITRPFSADRLPHAVAFAHTRRHLCSRQARRAHRFFARTIPACS
jgi:hypothetical protein